VHVVRGDRGQAPCPGQLGEQVVAVVVVRVPVIGQLHRHVVHTEQCGQPVQFRPGGGHTTLGQRLRHRTLAATGEDQHVVTQQRRHLLQVAVRRLTLLTAAQVRLRDRARQPGVTLRAVRQHQQVPPLGVGLTVLRFRQVQRQLRTEDGRQRQPPGRLGEPHHPVEPVVIGDGEPGQSQPRRLLGQLLGVAGAVEEAEVGVTVQFGVRNGGLGFDQWGCLVGLAFAAPGG
jgi:hypothetical protein